jgi:hypothetical protein
MWAAPSGAAFLLRIRSKEMKSEQVQSTVPAWISDVDYETLNFFAYAIHDGNLKAGWWTDLETGNPKDRNFGELIALCHSELSEAMEGHRKSKMDDHLPQYPMWWVEMADTFIRMMDMCGAGNVPIGEVVQAKLAYNAQREDHKIKARLLADGKKY